MCAIQDQVVDNKNYRTFIVKDGTIDDSCRQCNSALENVQHIISGCQTLIQLECKGTDKGLDLWEAPSSD